MGNFTCLWGQRASRGRLPWEDGQVQAHALLAERWKAGREMDGRLPLYKMRGCSRRPPSVKNMSILHHVQGKPGTSNCLPGK